MVLDDIINSEETTQRKNRLIKEYAEVLEYQIEHILDTILFHDIELINAEQEKDQATRMKRELDVYIKSYNTLRKVIRNYFWEHEEKLKNKK